MARHWFLNRRHDIFVDRGDPSGYDFTAVDFTLDAAWHDLDLSGVVPAKAKAVVIRLVAKNAAAQKNVSFKKRGNTNDYNIFRLYTQVADGSIENQFITPIDVNRFIEYQASAGAWTVLSLVISGWFN